VNPKVLRAVRPPIIIRGELSARCAGGADEQRRYERNESH
jgi:hypothetical protein